jgi:hypothetical protein
MLELEEKRVFPDNSAIIDVFNIVNNYCNSGRQKYEVLYDLFKSFITDCINESICLVNRVIIKDQDYINVFSRQIDKLNYVICLLTKLFMYLDQHFTVRNKKYKSLNELAFNLYKNEFFITLKGSLYKALSYYFKEIENRDNKENITKIKNIFKLMNDFDNISKPKIVRENNKIFWENDYNDYNDNKDNNIKEKHHFFDDWYDNYFIKDLDSSFEIKEKNKEFTNFRIYY